MLRVLGEKKRKAAYRPYKGGTPPDDIAPACKLMRDLVVRFP